MPVTPPGGGLPPEDQGALNPSLVPQMIYVPSQRGFMRLDTAVAGGFATPDGKLTPKGKGSDGNVTNPGGNSTGGGGGGGIDYTQAIKQIQAMAGAYGVSVSPALALQMIKSGQSDTEMRDRLSGIQLATQHAQFFQDIEAELKKPMTFKERVSSLLGMGSGDFYKAYENAINRYAAQTSGIKIFETPKELAAAGGNTDLSLTAKEIHGISQALPGAQVDLATQQAQLKQYAAYALQFFPESRLRGIKLTKDELLAVAGGNAGAVAEDKLARLQQEVQAAYQIRAGGIDVQKTRGRYIG